MSNDLTSSSLFMPPPALVAKLKLRSAELQMLPSVAIQVMQVSEKPDCSIMEYSKVVEQDLKLMSDMLKLANSAMYSPTTPIVSLHQAVLRLGLIQCQNLILSASATSMMKRMALGEKAIREVLTEHGFITALLAMHLNQLFQLRFLGEEFTSGLIHDFGRTLLAITVPDQFMSFDPLEFDETPDLLNRERLAVGTDHCLLGAYYAISQQLPQPLQEVILFHHEPEKAKEHKKLTALIAVADHMANHIQRYKESSSYDPAGNPFLPVLAEFVDSRFKKQFSEMAVSLMDKAKRDADAMLLS